MEPNVINSQQQPQTPTPAPDSEPVFGQSPQPHIKTPIPKRSNKELYIIVGTIVVIVVVALIGYLVFANMKSTPQPADNGKNGTTTAATDNSKVGQITSILTTGATDESKTTNTNDSSVASDATNTANSVGDSVNENNLK